MMILNSQPMPPLLLRNNAKEDEPAIPNALVSTLKNPSKEQEWETGNPPAPACPDVLTRRKKETRMNGMSCSTSKPTTQHT